MNTLQTFDAKECMEAEKRQAIASLIFLTDKRDVTIKERQCADGRKQQECRVKEEAASLTLTIEAIFITGIIGAKEDRQVALVTWGFFTCRQ